MRIVTWNIAGARTSRTAEQWDYHKNENLAYFIKHLQAVSPDVVCLQELHTNDKRSMAQEIAQALGLPHVYEVLTCPSHIDKNYKLANAILSKTPFTEPRSVLLPHPKFPLYINGKEVPSFDRHLLVVQFPGYQVATLHVEPLNILGSDYNKGQGLKFGREIDTILVQSLDRPFIFTGDLYTEIMKKPFATFMHTFALQEALPAKTPTTPKEGSPDHIVFTPEWWALSSRVIVTQSDHYLCVADIERAL